MVTSDDPLLQLLRLLKDANYRFEAVTPATHARVLARPERRHPTLRDIFGWSRPFGEADIEPALLECLRAAEALDQDGPVLRSKVRVASLGEDLLVHSAFPTDAPDAVFFGPDSYRFARWLGGLLPEHGPVRWLVDMGAGTGAGAIAAARLTDVHRTTLVDVNARALHYAGINAAAAGLDIEAWLSSETPAGPDLIIANPPYMIDPRHRAYRDGGGFMGGGIALDWCRQALDRLGPGGRLFLYTGVAFADGKSAMLDEVGRICAEAGAALEIDPIDVDVFGEELEAGAYAAVDRIGVVGITVSIGG